MNETAPVVSIIIPVYNGSDYLEEAIKSALNQTYKNIEVIVVNDGSTDHGKTRKIAECFRKSIKYYEKKNGGTASALNYGVQKATGFYFSWLSHDDVYYPEKIKRQLEIIGKDRSISVFSNFDIIDEKSNIVGSFSVQEENLTGLEYVLLGRINGCTLLVPIELIRSLGGFDEKLAVTQDYDLWLKLFYNNKLIHMNEKLVKYRIHSKQGTQENYSKDEIDLLNKNQIRFLSKKDFKVISKKVLVFYKIYKKIYKVNHALLSDFIDKSPFVWKIPLRIIRMYFRIRKFENR